MFEKSPRVTRGCLVITPPPDAQDFAQFIQVRNFWEVYRALPGRKNVFLREFLLRYFWYFQPSQTGDNGNAMFP